MVGDVLLGVDGRAVGDAGSLLDILADAGGSVSLRVMRGGEVSSVDVDPGALRPGRAA